MVALKVPFERLPESVSSIETPAVGFTLSVSVALATTFVSSWPDGRVTWARFTKALPALRFGSTVPVTVKWAVAPLARLTPVHSTWPVPRLVKPAPVLPVTVKPVGSVSITVALVVAEGPPLETVMA